VAGYRRDPAVVCPPDPAADCRQGRVAGYRRDPVVVCPLDPAADCRQGRVVAYRRDPAVDFRLVLAEGVRPARPANVRTKCLLSERVTTSRSRPAGTFVGCRAS
jgi:hypothetical protein